MSIQMIEVSEAKRTELIPKEFHPYFPDLCSFCKKPMSISTSCTILKCSNPHCLRRVSNQAAELLKDLGYKGYGPETLTNYCYAMGINSIVEFIKTPPPPIHLIEDINDLCPTFPKLVSLLHFPNLGTKAYKVFNGYDSLEDMYAKLGSSEEVIRHIFSSVGGFESTCQFVDLLADYEEDIREITDIITVHSQAANTILLEITGYIMNVKGENGQSLTKDQFVMALNAMARPHGIEFIRSSKFTQISFMVADAPSNSRKYRIGLERGILISSDTLWNVVSSYGSDKGKE